VQRALLGGDQHAAIGQEFHGPEMGQVFRHDLLAHGGRLSGLGRANLFGESGFLVRRIGGRGFDRLARCSFAALGGGGAFDLFLGHGGIILSESGGQQGKRERRTGEQVRNLHCDIRANALILKRKLLNLHSGFD
jgi:hypothetical protein